MKWSFRWTLVLLLVGGFGGGWVENAAAQGAAADGMTDTSQLPKDFCMTVFRGDVAAVRRALEAGGDPNRPQSGNSSDRPAEVAIRCGNPEMLPLLIEFGARTGALEKSSGFREWEDLLVCAARYRRPEMIRVLLKAGNDPNGPGSPLFAAIKGMWNAHPVSVRELEECVRILLENGADVNWKNTNGATPLWMAAAGGYAEVIPTLIDHGADRNVADSKGQTPIRMAAVGGHWEAIQVLEAAGAKLDRMPDGGFPFRIAAEKKSMAMARWFLEYGGKPRGGDALVAAIIQHDRAMATLLIENGADPNGIVNLGDDYITDYWRPLAIAIREDDLEMVELLLACGADMNASMCGEDDGKGDLIRWDNIVCDAVRCAKEHASSAILACLIRHGAEDPGGNTWQTDLLLAADAGDAERVRELLVPGRFHPRASSRGSDGRPPAPMAADGRTLLHLAARRGHIEVMDMLLRYGMNVNSGWYRTDNANYSPLCDAVLGHQMEMVRWLLKRGADPLIFTALARSGTEADREMQVWFVDELEKMDADAVTADYIARLRASLDREMATPVP